jgi:predicted DNA-binding protein YlxM (UPF0122 family)
MKTKTVSQIAKENNVSPQALYKRLNRLSTELKTYLHKDKNGRTLVDPDGERILTEGLNRVDNQGYKPVDNQTDHVVYEFNSFLQDQIKVKDQQIQDLLDQNKDLIQKVEYFQVLLKNEQVIKTLPRPDEDQEDRSEPKRNIFQRLFNRK